MALIELDTLTKDFVVYTRAGRLRRSRRVVRAVSDVTLSIEPGEIVGYIGPNGAGKSTTIKMLTGILVPTSGSIRVDGLDPQRRRVDLARRIGVVFGQRSQLWWDLPLLDSFELLRHVYGVPAGRHAENLQRYCDLLDLGAFLDTPVRQLSLGQRMRGELTAALLHDPSVVYLDEPTIGLDVVSKDRVRAFLAEINRERGVTILLTTHDLDDVEQLSSRLVVIDEGRVIHDGTVDEVKARYVGHRTLVVDFEAPRAAVQLDGVSVFQVDGARQWLRFRRDDVSVADLIARVVAVASVRDLTIEEPDIDDVVKRIYGRDGRAQQEGIA
ncbi:MAG: ATP-binding cassette domain-containing protein [Acidimicrobiia bacterium]